LGSGRQGKSILNAYWRSLNRRLVVMSSPAGALPLILLADPAEGTFRRRPVAAIAVVAAAMVLTAVPALVALVAIVSPRALDSLVAWLRGGSGAFSLVAAGRVPAAALVLVILAYRRTRS
jgi:hypothetical protein